MLKVKFKYIFRQVQRNWCVDGKNVIAYASKGKKVIGFRWNMRLYEL